MSLANALSVLSGEIARIAEARTHEIFFRTDTREMTFCITWSRLRDDTDITRYYDLKLTEGNLLLITHKLREAIPPAYRKEF